MKVLSLSILPVFMIILNARAQFDESFSIPKESTHSLNVTPVSITLNKNLFWGHAVNYKWNITRRFDFVAAANGTLFNKLDGNRSQNQNILCLNESEFQIGYRYPIGFMMKTEKGVSQMQQKWSLGYHYFQRGADINSWDYWIIDSTQAAGYTKLSGVRSHSICLATELSFYQYKIQDEKLIPSSENHFRLTYIYNLQNSLGMYDEHGETWSVSNYFGTQRHGVKLNYDYTHLFNEHFALNLDVQLAYMPQIEYKPNFDYFVWRGSEAFRPLFISARPGVILKF